MRLSNLLTLGLSLALIGACSEWSTGPIEVEDPLFAKGGTPGPPGGGDGGGDDGTVDADSSANFLFPVSGYDMVSDGALQFQNSGVSLYEDNVCGVQGTVYDPSGDAVMDSDVSRGGAKKCADFPRKLSLTYRDASGAVLGSEEVAVFLNLQGVWQMAPGETRTDVPLNIGLENSGSCESLRFRSQLRDGSSEDADYVTVTRNTDGSWTASNSLSDTNGDGVASQVSCVNGGVQTAAYVMELSFTVVATGPES